MDSAPFPLMKLLFFIVLYVSLFTCTYVRLSRNAHFFIISFKIIKEPSGV